MERSPDPGPLRAGTAPSGDLRSAGRALASGWRLFLGKFMDVLNPVVVRMAGANINRHTVDNVRAAGFSSVTGDSNGRDAGCLRDLEVLRSVVDMVPRPRYPNGPDFGTIRPYLRETGDPRSRSVFSVQRISRV